MLKASLHGVEKIEVIKTRYYLIALRVSLFRVIIMVPILSCLNSVKQNEKIVHSPL